MEKRKMKKRKRIYYAYRFGFGQEGHGRSICVAEGPSIEATEALAKKALQAEFGGLWAGKLRDTFVGSKTWLKSKGFDL